MRQQALCMIKPDGMEYQLAIKDYILSQQIIIIQEKRILLTNGDIDILYEPLLESNLDAVKLAYKSLTAGEVLLILCSGVDIFLKLKKIKHYLRSVYVKNNPFGIIHTSEHYEESLRELNHFFKS